MRERVGAADLVSVKVDTVDETVWRRINLPHHDLDLHVILDGVRTFAAGYRGALITDTMLIAGINDGRACLAATADFLAAIGPQTAYLAIPTRPTTVPGVHGVDDAGLVRAYELFSARLRRVELLAGHEIGAFAHTGNARDDLLAITAVHPMREAAVRELLRKDHAAWSLVEGLVADGMLKCVDHEGERFFLRPVRCARQLV